MKIVIPKEYVSGERRVPVIPSNVKQLVKLGAQVEIEANMGKTSGYSDDEYISAGATVSGDRKALLSSADVVLRLHKPPVEEIDWLKKGGIHISYLDPFNEKELLDKFVSHGISAISMEMIPRVTRAQKMDALSSQTSLAGYAAVIIAAERLNKIFPMMMTPAGTISPSRVFVIGVGVAGLQAIATAKRLGARVEAFDTRPVVEEQVQSLGAKFVKIDLGETGQTKDGYAKALTEEQIDKQRQEMANHDRADIRQEGAADRHKRDDRCNEKWECRCRSCRGKRWKCGMHCAGGRSCRERCNNYRPGKYSGPCSHQYEPDVLQQSPWFHYRILE